MKRHQKHRSLKAKTKNLQALDKRFKILLLIVIGLMLIGSLIKVMDGSIFEEFAVWVTIGICSWFYFDYKMLSSSRHYLYCLLLASGYLVFFILIYGGINLAIQSVPCVQPILFLMCQKPLRLLFKVLFKREPVVEDPMPSFWDGVYMMVLFFVVLFCHWQLATK
ncbi:MAG: hypothetical protein RL660_1737 [Bacteroidota bacterium]|jgi:hypothetical protein